MARISSKNQITLPARDLREAGLSAGDEVVVRVVRGHLEITPAKDSLAALAGALKPGTIPPGAAKELRREWSR